MAVRQIAGRRENAMSNLSFARIMYGSNEDSAVSAWMHTSSAQSQFSGVPSPAASSPQNWMQKLLAAVMPGRESGASGSSKKFF
jgi:hypothetical protein